MIERKAFNEYTLTKEKTIQKAIEICQETLLFRNLSKEQKQIITLTLLDNIDYCDDLVGWYYGNSIDIEDNEYSLTRFENSLAHDLSGLYRKDEHFVPRINNITHH
jgi:hypothetical protein